MCDRYRESELLDGLDDARMPRLHELGIIGNTAASLGEQLTAPGEIGVEGAHSLGSPRGYTSRAHAFGD